MKIFDCFLFYNEFDLLELRLRELYDHVDHIVLIESDHTLTNRAKPYLFEQHQARYSRWLDKITHVKHQSRCHSDPWLNVYDQRNALIDGLSQAHDDDVVIFNDVDEIVRVDAIQQIRMHDQSLIYGLHMPLFNFRFNFMRVDPEPYNIWTTAARASWVKKHNGQMLRNQLGNLLDLPFEYAWNQKDQVHWTQDNTTVIQHGGWHFSYLGDNEWLRDKAANTCHQEENTAELLAQLDVEKSLAEKKSWNRHWPYCYEIVDLDDYFPKSCGLFPQWCLPNAGIRAVDILNKYAT